MSKWLFRLVVACLVALVAALLVFRLSGSENISLFMVVAASILLAAIFAVVGLSTATVSLLRKKPVSGRLLLMMILGLSPLTGVLLLVGDGFSAPAIHDITTDVQNPPVFQFAAADRAPGSNSLQLDSETLALQQEHYPEFQPVYMDASPRLVAGLVELIVEAQGWRVLGRAQNPYQLEAVEQTALMGFKDDIAIRVTPAGAGAVVDVRSASRVGQGDLGANALRIVEFITALNRAYERAEKKLDSNG